MYGNSIRVSGQGQNDLCAVTTMIAAIAIGGIFFVFGAGKLAAGQIIKNESNLVGKRLGIKVFLNSDPLA